MSPNEDERIPLGANRKKRQKLSDIPRIRHIRAKERVVFSSEVKEPLHQPEVCLLASALFDYEQLSKSNNLFLL